MASSIFAGPPPIFLQIDQAMRLGEMDDAMRLARLALEQGHKDAVLFNLRAYWHEAQGDFGAALADLERARTLSPRDPRILNAIGRCLSANGQSDMALAPLADALELQPGLAEAHYNRGFALEQLAELDAAGKSYRKAVSLQPNMTDAVARLAGLAARASDWDEARRLARRALNDDADHAIAHTALIMAELGARDYPAAEQRARQVIASPRTVPQARANAQHFLGDALDGQDRPAEAFAAYAQGNAALRASFHDRFGGGNLESGLARVQRLGRELDSVNASDWANSAPRTGHRPPIFLMGFARSGTTLLGQVLGSHGDIIGLEEQPLLKEAVEERLLPPGATAALAALPQAECDRYRALYWQHAQATDSAAASHILLDQSPFNSLHLPVIAALFPGAKVIFALRDPRDVVLSCFRRLFAPNLYVYEFLSLTRTAEFYDATMHLAQRGRDILPLQFHDLRNEDLVADFEGTMKSLCAWLELPWDPAMGNFARAPRRAIATPSATQVARGIRADGIGQWRRYEKQMQPVLPLLAPWVAHFGYDPEQGSSHA